MAERLRVREIDDDEGRRLVRIVRRGSGSVVTWRRAQMVLLSAQCMDAAAIAKVAFTREDRVRDVIRNVKSAVQTYRLHPTACRPARRSSLGRDNRERKAPSGRFLAEAGVPLMVEGSSR